MNQLIAVAMLVLISTSAAAQTAWINIAKSNEGIWDAQPGSLEFSKTKGDIFIAVVVGRITDPKTSKISLYKWYVSASDCKAKMGKVVTLDISGEYKFENDFVFGSGSIATSMAELICGAADYAISEKSKKSL